MLRRTVRVEAALEVTTVERWSWDDEVAAELARRFRGWTSAVSACDSATLDDYLHPDYLYVTVFGKRLGKEDYLQMVDGLAPGGEFVLHRTSARVNGDFAELDGEYTVTGGTSAGEDLSAHTRFTATWLRARDGIWRCLTHHGTIYQPHQETPVS